MPPRIDPARREIAVGTRRLPFRLDLRNDRVSVTLGGAETAVRPLQWREKVTLARFADLGPEFLRDEVIRLCTVSELPSPLASEDAEVLWELAAWMSESPASAPVPLDSRSLATVTLRLCRAMGLKPADFDSRSAPEVEALWEALGQQAEEVVATEESSSSSSTTRIMIVPDDQRTAAVPAADREASRLPGGRDARATAGGTPAVRQDAESVAQTQTRAVASQSIGAVAMASAGNAQPRADVIPSGGTSRSAGEDEMTVPRAGGAQEGSRWQARSAQPPDPDAPPIFGPGGAADGVLAPLRGLPPADMECGGKAAALKFARLEQHACELTANEFESGGLAAALHSAAESPAPHHFFEELADRLEQAAAEMGLGEE